ncbi:MULTISPECIES: DUF7601 domain-containing protein [Faecalibacterium]|uniref:DUF7601 domain-containing protein n=1 Tax=Faecalibacterium hominis (ex Afrizal et al. 2022) TaxID=2881265 RepID=A0ABS8FHV9_9FIRM|nr:FctA domain-containing protein [Faecalibacterium hominis (ex Afrizal et al. 2022)]MCC2212882.1 hypothetical protein [Faecalibacterium hominis (ex Afrizal et al. 2022)]
MKLKKFFAGVLAAAMMLTVGATSAFAAGTQPTTKITPNEGKAMVTLTKQLTVKNGVAPSGMEFEFKIEPGTANAAEHVVAGEVASGFQNPTVTMTPESGTYTATTTPYKAEFSFDLIKLLGGNATKLGKYAYTITEVEPNLPGITKDNEILNMVVSVVNADKDDPDGSNYAYYVALRKGNATEKAEGKFNNDYETNSLTLAKKVKGNFGDLSETFTFYVTFNKGDATKTYTDILFDKHGDGITITEKNGSAAATALTYGKDYAVTLKHGQDVQFTNIPNGVTYTIAEDTTKADWQYTVSLESNPSVALSNATTEGTVSETATVTFINNHQGTPDMGVVLDNAPYIAMLAIVAIGGVALMLNKRRRDEE